MKNEDTRLINGETINPESSVNSVPEKKSSKGETLAAVAGGFAAGGVAGAATGVMASDHENHEIVAENVEDNEKPENQIQEVPEPEDVLLANNEGIRFAHIDADNFAEAFAQAREQIGPGGAFEYNGKIYATYYEEEWNNLTNQERADFQSRVMGIVPAQPAINTQDDIASKEGNEEIPSDGDYRSEDSVPDIHVVDVRQIVAEDGSIMNVALLENEGEHAIMMDVDADGTMDVLVYDANHNNIIEDNEIYDVSGARIHVDELLSMQASQEGDYLAASDDGMPDYINDADSSLEV